MLSRLTPQMFPTFLTNTICWGMSPQREIAPPQLGKKQLQKNALHVALSLAKCLVTFSWILPRIKQWT